MLSIRSILVVVDPVEDTDTRQSPALDRACQLAAVTGADLHLLLCSDRPQDDDLLHSLKAEVLADDCSVSAERAWEGSVHDTVTEVARREECDLVVKQHLPDSSLKKVLLTPGDWKLLRECPVPVLMVRRKSNWGQGTVLAAVDLGNLEDEHQALQADVLRYAREVARLEEGRVLAVAAYPAPVLTNAEPGLMQHEETVAMYQQVGERFCERHDLLSQHFELGAGPADVFIPSVAQRENAVLAVLGNVARDGLAGAFIGNTAEVVLDSLECDVLVVKASV